MAGVDEEAWRIGFVSLGCVRKDREAEISLCEAGKEVDEIGR